MNRKEAGYEGGDSLPHSKQSSLEDSCESSNETLSSIKYKEFFGRWMIIIPEDGLCPTASYIIDKQHLTILCSLEHLVTAVWVLTAATSKLQRSGVSIFLLVISYDRASTLMGQLASDARNTVQISSTLSWTSFWGSAFSCCTASQNLQQFALCVVTDSNTGPLYRH